jgi:Phytochelatin synthase
MRHATGLLLALMLCLSPAGAPWAQEAKPKLGPDAVSIERSHSYLRRHAAPDFWRLGPYYVPQATGSACSLAAITMLVNALCGLPARNDDPLATQEAVLQAVASEAWTRQTAENGSGVTFAELVRYLHLSLEAFHLDAEIEVLKPGDNFAATLHKLRRILAANERTDRDIALVYFNQGVLTGAWDGPHISPIGAYDAARRRVLVMDVDRQWYIPYWASDETLLAAMLRPAPSRGPLAGETGGLVRAILKSAARR